GSCARPAPRGGAPAARHLLARVERRGVAGAREPAVERVPSPPQPQLAAAEGARQRAERAPLAQVVVRAADDGGIGHVPTVVERAADTADAAARAPSAAAERAAG